MPTPACCGWLQVPLILTTRPFSRNPRAASQATVRMPNVVWTVSTVTPPTRTSLASRYRCGVSHDHSRGSATSTPADQLPRLAGGHGRGRRPLGHDPAVGPVEPADQLDRRVGPAVVRHRRPRPHVRHPIADVAGDDGPVLGHVDRIGLEQPHVTVDARPLVPPALVMGRVGPDGDDVLLAVLDHVGHVVREARVPAGVAAHAVAVHPDDAVAEDGVEHDRDPPAQVRRGDGELPPVPADAGGRVVRPDRPEAVFGQLLVPAGVERQLDGPVVRHVDPPPLAVVERAAGRPACLAGLDQAAVAGELEVHRRVGRVAEGERPPAVERQPLPPASGPVLRCRTVAHAVHHSDFRPRVTAGSGKVQKDRAR